MTAKTVQVYEAGELVSESHVPISDAEANQQSLLSAAQNALSVNRTFIASAPNNAQVVAQVKALSRQMNALIRLQLNQLDGTD